MRKTSKLPRAGISATKVLSICLVLAVLAGVGASVWIKISDNKTIAALKEQIAQAVPDTTSSSTLPEDYDPAAAAAEYNGGIVTAQEATEAYSTIASYYEMLGDDPANYEENAKREVIDSLVEDKILEAKAKELGVYELTDAQKAELEAQVTENYESQIDYYMGFRFDDSQTEEELRADTIAYLNENGMSYDELYTQASKDMWRENLRTYLVSNVTIDDSDVREYYQNQVETKKIAYAADFSMYEQDREFGNTIVYNPAGVRTVQAILIPFDSDQLGTYIALRAQIDAGDESKQAELDALYAQILPTAQEVLDRAKAGEDFTLLMDECSADANLKTEPARSTGYYVGAQSTAYSTAFVTAAMGLENIGDISDLVYLDSGIYILRYATDVAEGEVPYEEVCDALAEGCLEEKKNSAYNEIVDGYLADANIVYHLDRF